MINTDADALPQDRNTEKFLKPELKRRHAGKSYNKRDGIDAYRKKLYKDVKIIKILKHLIKRGPTLVNDAVKILIAPQTTRDLIIYQLFLRDVLRYYGPGLIILYTASFEKQRVIHLAEKNRTGLVDYLKNNKPNLRYPALESLAKEYQIPSIDDL